MKPMLAFVAVALLAAAQAPKDKDAKEDPAKADLKKLEGSWKIEKVTRDGAAQPEQPEELVFAGDKITLKGAGKELKGTFKIDPAKKPKAIDVTPEEGGAKGTMKGVYELDGDNLKLSFGRGPDADRPTELTDKQATLVVLKRNKKS